MSCVYLLLLELFEARSRSPAVAAPMRASTCGGDFYADIGNEALEIVKMGSLTPRLGFRRLGKWSAKMNQQKKMGRTHWCILWAVFYSG